MPKDPTENIPNYKIGGGHLNEYEFNQQKGQMSKEKDNLPKPKPGATKPDSENEFMENQGSGGGGESDSSG